VASLTIERLQNLRGWRGKLACFVAGAITALGFAPFYGWPIIFLTFPFLFLMLDKARHPRSAALYALAFGYGYTMAGTYWIANALMVDMAKFGWLIPISVLGLSLVLALWFALFGALYRWTRTSSLSINLLRFAVLFTLVEYARSYGMFGFPWNLMGMMALGFEPFAQFASIIGTFGLGFILVLLALLPVIWLQPNPRTTLIASTFALVVVGGIVGWGYQRLPQTVALSDVPVRLVQGNIPQSLKWTEEGRREAAHIYSTLTQSQEGTALRPAIVVWPETALPFTLREENQWDAGLAKILPENGMLITGAVRAEAEVDAYRLYNSIAFLDAEGTWHTPYDKHQLVPFGEFVPLRSVLPLDKITPGNVDFSRGVGAVTQHLKNVPPFSALVCYEIIFPWMAVNAEERPHWIVNATNDAWYGISTGPYQHFDMARMRALEQGLPVVRAANTGISGVIDPYGRVVKSLGLNQRGIIDAALPEPVESTFYSRFGEKTILIWLVLGWSVTIVLLFHRKK
jgi:apolipoprotein N-acyltransferase